MTTFTTSQFPIAKVSERHMGIFNAALTQGSVLKSELSDLSHIANSYLSDALSNAAFPYRTHLSTEERDVYYTFPTMHSLAKYRVKASKLNTPYGDALIAVVDELTPLISAIQTLTIVTRQQKLEAVSKAKEESLPTATKQIREKVRSILTDMTEQMKAHQVEDMLEAIREMVARVTACTDTEKLKVMLQDNSYLALLFSPKNGSVILRSDWEARAYRLCVDSANYSQAKFVGKNVSKLSAIIELVNSDMTTSVTSLDVYRGTIESTIHFSFANGMRFKVVNKVVLKHGEGFLYQQFPTTFHNVYIPNKLSNPSERLIIAHLQRGGN